MLAIINYLKEFWAQNAAFFQMSSETGRIVLNNIYVFFNAIFYIVLYMAVVFTLIYLLITLVVLIFGKKKDEKEFIPEKAPFVSIQIPTKNEIIALRCAERCLEFDYPKDKYEIIIGDDSDKEDISAKINEFAAKHPQIKVTKRTDNIGFKPGNLNHMLKYSNGEVLVIFDSDFTPDKDFLKRIVTPFIYDDEISAVQAKWNFNNFNQNMVSTLASTIVYVFHHSVLRFMNIFGTGSLCGSAEAIKKEDLINLGGWKSGSLTEDIEYSLRLHKTNKKIVYLPYLECYSDVPYIASDLYKQQMRWAHGVIGSYKAHLKEILSSKQIAAKRKILSFAAGFGYIMPVFILLLFVTGTVSFITNAPGPVDLLKFISELGINVLLTSGLLIASFIALYKENKVKYALKTLIASFSIGLVTTYYVNKGIFKSLMGKPMQWYLLNKETKLQ